MAEMMLLIIFPSSVLGQPPNFVRVGVAARRLGNDSTDRITTVYENELSPLFVELV